MPFSLGPLFQRTLTVANLHSGESTCKPAILREVIYHLLSSTSYASEEIILTSYIIPEFSRLT